MIQKCQEILKLGTYDYDKFEIEVGPLAPCSVVQGLFPQILDMALELLKRKASISLLEWIDEEPKKTCNTEYKNHELKLKNKLLPVYDWNLANG